MASLEVDTELAALFQFCTETNVQYQDSREENFDPVRLDEDGLQAKIPGLVRSSHRGFDA
jgi:hypothetical protein